jgi:glycogen operon protein
MELWPGHPRPLGLRYDGTGANVAVFAPHAEVVELCLFSAADPADPTEARMELPDRSGPVHHGYVRRLDPGTRYGFRVHGPWDPRRGHTSNPAKLLLDPYAQAIDGGITPHPALAIAHPDLSPNTEDSAPYVPRSVVVNPYFDWDGDTPPLTPLDESVLYEAHVKGLTRLWPDMDPELRGSYAGLAEPGVTDHLQRLGVTAVELLPVHHKIHDPFLQGRGLSNYWGYQTIGYFAPHDEYAALGSGGQQVQEFRRMVQALHRAGIEVILDVVFNHTAEGGFLGPTLSFRGLDGHYYHAQPDDQTRYVDYTGCGNSLDTENPFVLQLIMDSLRYWVTEMHVDGFRFDLAVTLSRDEGNPERTAAFFDIVQQDPVVSGVKLIAEPWDIGGGGYQVGNFPWQWAEWNGRFRDCVRDVWRSVPGTMPEMATRFTGSADLYGDDGRRPYSSVNFVTAHDGFTLLDLVSYDSKHNEANGEDNRDGESHNRSWNCGAEGETDDPDILALRARQQRNLLATLLLAQGVPMLLAGDEIGHTQRGNNNAYCQDNEIAWIDWAATDSDLLEFTERLIALRASNSVFRRRHFFSGQAHNGAGLPDAVWFTPDGRAMTSTDWTYPGMLQVGVFLNGDVVGRRDRHGEGRRSHTFFLCFNAHWEPATFTVPDKQYGLGWTRVVDTGDDHMSPLTVPYAGTVPLVSRSVVVLERTDGPGVVRGTT